MPVPRASAPAGELPTTAIAGWKNNEGGARVDRRVNSKRKIAQGESRKIMKCLWAALWTSFGIVSAQAFTCADVRTLSLEQQAYYIKVFNITPAQQ
jgi:hypothetical protein